MRPFPRAQEQAHAGKKIILYSSDEPDKKANAAVLIVLYAVSSTAEPTPEIGCSG